LELKLKVLGGTAMVLLGLTLDAQGCMTEHTALRLDLAARVWSVVVVQGERTQTLGQVEDRTLTSQEYYCVQAKVLEGRYLSVWVDGGIFFSQLKLPNAVMGPLGLALLPQARAAVQAWVVLPTLGQTKHVTNGFTENALVQPGQGGELLGAQRGQAMGSQETQEGFGGYMGHTLATKRMKEKEVEEEEEAGGEQVAGVRNGYEEVLALRPDAGSNEAGPYLGSSSQESLLVETVEAAILKRGQVIAELEAPVTLLLHCCLPVV
jgi:hypothetical protein